MALINCKVCNKQISDTALKCVGCGSPIKKKDSNVAVVKKKESWEKVFFIIILLIIIFIVTLALISKKSPEISKDLTPQIKSIEFIATIVEVIDSIEPEEKKIYLSHVLEVNETVNRIAYDSNGNFLGSFDEEGLRKGIWKGFYPNNVLAFEGPYNDGLMNGHFKHYYRNGLLKHEGMYKNGTKKNININSGVPQEGREGLHIFYYTNGAVKSKIVHTNSHYNGSSQSWHKNGIKQDERVFRNGNLVREQVWDINGECIKKD